jgi:hypothetical protein
VSYAFDDDDDELDAVGLCPHCGMRRVHRDTVECLADMRGWVAELQLELDSLKERQVHNKPHCDRRMVILHGREMDLEAAAAALGCTPSALRGRLARRRAQGVVDIEALGITTAVPPGGKSRAHESD